MALTLTNRARHLVIVELNNGDSLYLPPGRSSGPIDAGQISGNEKILKMQRNSDLSVSDQSSSEVTAAEAEAGTDQAAAKDEADQVSTSAGRKGRRG